MLTDVQIINVPVSDQDAAHDFYVGTLGLSVLADEHMGPHGRWLQLAPAREGAASLALTTDQSASGSLRGLVFTTDDIEGDVGRLADAGVAFPDGIEDMPWARAARFTDPDGNQLVLQTPTGPS